MIWNKSRKCPSGKGKKTVKERNPVQRSSGKLCQGKGVTSSCRRKVGLSLYTHPSHSPPETLTLDSPDMDQHSTPSTQLQLYPHSLLIPLSFLREPQALPYAQNPMNFPWGSQRMWALALECLRGSCLCLIHCGTEGRWGPAENSVFTLVAWGQQYYTELSCSFINTLLLGIW